MRCGALCWFSPIGESNGSSQYDSYRVLNGVSVRILWFPVVEHRGSSSASWGCWLLSDDAKDLGLVRAVRCSRPVVPANTPT
jgi:hypothetical protein